MTGSDGDRDEFEAAVESIEVASAAPAQVERVPIEHRQETTRAWIAAGLLLLLGVLIVATFVAVLFTNTAWDDVKDAVAYLLGLLVGLVGTVVGFYFGTKSGSG